MLKYFIIIMIWIRKSKKKLRFWEIYWDSAEILKIFTKILKIPKISQRFQRFRWDSRDSKDSEKIPKIPLKFQRFLRFGWDSKDSKDSWKILRKWHEIPQLISPSLQYMSRPWLFSHKNRKSGSCYLQCPNISVQIRSLTSKNAQGFTI